MASTNFIDKTTVVPTAWLNEVNGTVWTLFGAATTASAGRTALGLGTIATQDASNVNITGGAISNLSSPIPVPSGGTGTTTSTGSGSVVKADSPTITNLLISGSIISSATGGGDIVRFVGTSGSAENSLRVDQTQTTSGTALKLSNSGLNKQATLRGNSDGGFTFYVNQAAGGASTSGTSSLTITGANAFSVTGAASFSSTLAATGAITENTQRVFSRNSMSAPATQVLDAATKAFTFTHSLTSTPTIAIVYLKCVATEGGYAVNDEIIITGMGTNNSSCVQPTLTTTTVVVPIFTTLSIATKDGTGQFNPTMAASPSHKWEIGIRAWY